MEFFPLGPKRAAENANKQALPVPTYQLVSDQEPAAFWMLAGWLRTSSKRKQECKAVQC